MNKKTIYYVGGALVAIVLIAGAVLSRTQSNPNNHTTTTSTNNSDGDKFNPTPTSDLAYEARMVTSAPGNNMTFISDGKGNFARKFENAGATYAMYKFGDSYMQCLQDRCMEMTESTGAAAFQSEDNIQFSAERINALSRQLQADGQAPCGSGQQCTKWASKVSSVTTEILVSQDNKIMQVTNASGDSSFTVTYSYSDVTLKRPANVDALPVMPN